MRVAIQPCGDSVGRQHYVDTIEKLVTTDRIRPFLTTDQRRAFDVCFDGPVAVWGVTHGEKGVNRKKWDRLRSGDVALLYRDKTIFSQGRIALTINNAPLARDLWQETPKGDTWENIYFLDDLREMEVPVQRFNQALGYKPAAIVQGFNVYEGDKAKALLDLLEVDEEEAAFSSAETSPAVLQQRLKELQTLNLPASSHSRSEQGIFRTHLFGKKLVAACDLCGRMLPRELLVAAHIKKRASATDEERRDLNIVMSACKLGCDELYERGFVYVDENGTIGVNNSSAAVTPDLVRHAKTLYGLKCSAFRLETKAYYEWHRKRPRRLLGKARNV
jgi:hypothetical protein